MTSTIAFSLMFRVECDESNNIMGCIINSLVVCKGHVRVRVNFKYISSLSTAESYYKNVTLL